MLNFRVGTAYVGSVTLHYVVNCIIGEIVYGPDKDIKLT